MALVKTHMMPDSKLDLECMQDSQVAAICHEQQAQCQCAAQVLVQAMEVHHQLALSHRIHTAQLDHVLNQTPLKSLVQIVMVVAADFKVCHAALAIHHQHITCRGLPRHHQGMVDQLVEMEIRIWLYNLLLLVASMAVWAMVEYLLRLEVAQGLMLHVR